MLLKAIYTVPRRLMCVLLLVALTSAASAGEQVLEIIPLKHRMVSDVLPTLQQLVAPGGTVTGMNDQLIIRTSPENLADLKQVLDALDRKLHQLRITVRQDIEADTQLREDELSARIRSGDASAGVGQPRGGPGARIGIGEADQRVEYHAFSTRREQDTEHAHFVTTVEGQPAFINAGQAVPLADRQVHYSPWGTTVQDSVRYRNVGAGFYVTPRLGGGNSVSLEISPYAEQLDPRGGGAIDSRGLATMVHGQLGQWIALGGAGQAGGDSAAGLLYRSRQSGRNSYDVWVKVDVIP